jgi:Polyketide cyclase / dehydrase and lipid transport
MSETKTIQYPVATDNLRIEKSYTIEIESTPDKIFPLACPVEELRWIPDWEYSLEYSKRGINENNCIFKEQKSGPIIFGKVINTTWVTTLYDPEKHRVHFLLNMEGEAVIKWEFQCCQTGTNVSTVTWSLTFTALDRQANGLDPQTVSNGLTLIMEFLSNALKHYCETGQLISSEGGP